MILFFEHGRLGNQLFQYCGLRQYFPKEKLVFLGCEDLEDNFESVNVRFISKNALSRWIPIGLLRRIVFSLVSVGFFGLITEDKSSDVFKLKVRRGLFFKFFVAKDVFFQHRDVVGQLHCTPHLKCHLYIAAKNWLHKKQTCSESNSLVFVHVRRGDYVNWPSSRFPAVLSLDWYNRTMKLISQKIDNPVFVLMGDDLYYLRDVFNESENLIISDNTSEVDFAIMSLCHSGILSASSFAWWGAYFSRSKNKCNTNFLAPMYWGGHRSKLWHPVGFYTEWITYIE
jgi:hypothetical protein